MQLGTSQRAFIRFVQLTARVHGLRVELCIHQHANWLCLVQVIFLLPFLLLFSFSVLALRHADHDFTRL